MTGSGARLIVYCGNFSGRFGGQFSMEDKMYTEPKKNIDELNAEGLLLEGSTTQNRGQTCHGTLTSNTVLVCVGRTLFLSEMHHLRLS